MGDSNECPFLQLPTELRLLIYGFALLDSPAITIGTAELKGAHPDIVHRLYGNKRSPYDGLPRNHEPVLETRYNPSLLSITNPAIVPLTPATSCPPEYPFDKAEHRTHCSLLQVNRQIQEELTSHFNIAKNRRSSLFVSYPHGLHVMQTLTKPLIQSAKSVHIAGIYKPKTFDPQRAAAFVSPQEHAATAAEKYHGDKAPDHAEHLANLVASLFGPHAEHTVRILELRIYYPGADSYSTVWGDESSPTVVALRNTCGGEINIEVWRGRWGTGVYMTVKGSPTISDQRGESRKKRIVSTVWRRLEEGRRGEPECGSWVVDPHWPECNAMVEGVEKDRLVDVHIDETLS